jgi:hypothetical protein
MPTFIKTGFWDKKAKAPDGWLDLNQFVQTLIPPPPPSTNIYNSDGTLTENRQLNGANSFSLTYQSLTNFNIINNAANGGFYCNLQNNTYGIGRQLFESVILSSDNQYVRIKSGFSNEFFVSSTGISSFSGDVSLKLEKNNNKIKTQYQGLDNGLNLDFTNDLYQFGQINGGNATTLKIDDAAAFPVQVSGTNVSSGTAGAASGQFLNVKVNGVDYKIALLNP